MSSTELARLVAASVDPEAANWLEHALAGVGPGAASALAAFVAASRKLGRGPLAAPEGAAVRGLEGQVSIATWQADRAGRVALLLAMAERAPAELESAVTTLYREGDSREKAAVVASLSLLPEPGRFLELALDAGRTNEVDLFRALAADNPFPARHYGEAELPKLVMKAAFVGVPLDRIIGVVERANPELARMGMDYVDEQQSASRSFPPGIWLAIAPCNPPGALARMLGELEHAVAARRLGAARGLALCRDDRARPFLAERAGRERDPEVADAIAAALEALS